MRAAPGDVLFRIVDHDIVWVMADVAERDLGLVEVGQKVVVRPRAHPDHPFAGKVTVIYQTWVLGVSVSDEHRRDLEAARRDELELRRV